MTPEVLTVHGLDDFGEEYAPALEQNLDGIPVKVLPLGRIIASKRTTNRPKDIAALPALEATLHARDAIRASLRDQSSPR